MGIYDREYYREETPGFQIRKPGTMVGWLIVINIIVFLAAVLLGGERFQTGGPVFYKLNDILGLEADTLFKPWLWWQFLTYGFCHASVWHIVGNMIGLFFLGAPVERHYGSKEFLRIYLVMIVFAGIVWAASVQLMTIPHASVVGASGGVVGVVVLFALNYPRATVLLMGVLPMPAWVLGVLLVASDLFTSIKPGSSQVAFQAHLAGAALAFLYWKNRWNFTRLTDKITSAKIFQSGPRLRVHQPDDEEDGYDRREAARDEEVDRILSKVHREGRESLTRKERRILERESQRLREKQGRS